MHLRSARDNHQQEPPPLSPTRTFRVKRQATRYQHSTRMRFVINCPIKSSKAAIASLAYLEFVLKFGTGPPLPTPTTYGPNYSNSTPVQTPAAKKYLPNPRSAPPASISLGTSLLQAGVCLYRIKAVALINISMPTNVKQLGNVFGSCSSYRSFWHFFFHRV